MNILYEGLKQKGGMMVIPSSIVDSMGPSGLLSVAALARQQSREAEPETPKLPAGEQPSDWQP
jgi:hypothetical protein